MKKLTMILSAVLLMTSILILSGSAASFLPGDMNGDKKITASDARSVLRIAAKLDDASAELLKVADVNNDGEVRAADARIVLRVAAQLESIPEYDDPSDEPTSDIPVIAEQPSADNPEDKEPETDSEQKLPSDVQIFLGSTYTLTGNIYTPGEVTPIDALLICDGMMLRMDSTMDGLTFGILSDTGEENAYIINPAKNIYTPLSSTLIKTLGIADFFSSDMFTSIDNGEEDPEPVISFGTLNGQQSVVYTFIYSDSKIELITVDEKIAVINNYSLNGELTMRIEVTSFTDQVDSNMLKLDGLTKVSVPSLISSFFDFGF